MAKPKPSQDERNKRRAAHKGWMIQALTAERCCRIHPQHFTAAKLAELGYPKEFIWPEFEDFAGATVLIEMVMAKDLEGIRKLKLRHPMVSFGLDEWMAGIEKESELAANITRKPINTPKNRALYQDYTVQHFIQTDTNEGTESIVAVIFKGRKEIVSTTLASRKLDQ